MSIEKTWWWQVPWGTWCEKGSWTRSSTSTRHGSKCYSLFINTWSTTKRGNNFFVLYYIRIIPPIISTNTRNLEEAIYIPPFLHLMNNKWIKLISLLIHERSTKWGKASGSLCLFRELFSGWGTTWLSPHFLKKKTVGDVIIAPSVCPTRRLLLNGCAEIHQTW